MIKHKGEKQRTNYDLKKHTATIFDFFASLNKNKNNVMLFLPELVLAMKGGALETFYIRHKRKEELTVKKGDNVFYISDHASSYHEERLSPVMATKIYLYIIAYLDSSNKQDNSEIENITLDDLETNARDTFIKMFYNAFTELLTMTTVSTLDTQFIAMLNALSKSSGKNIAYYLSQTCSHLFLNVYHKPPQKNKIKNKHKNPFPCLPRTSLAGDLGSAVVQYIILHEDNVKLNNMITLLDPVKFHAISKDNLEKIIKIINVMQKGTKKEITTYMMDTFSYTKKLSNDLGQEITITKKLNVLYHDILLGHLYELVYELYTNYPRYVKKVLNEYNIQMDTEIKYSHTYKTRIVRLGSLIINIIVKHNICDEKIEYDAPRTVNMIYLTDRYVLEGLDMLYNYNKPHIMTHPMSTSELKIDKDLKDYVTKETLVLYEIQERNKRRKLHASQGIYLTYNYKKGEHIYTPKTKYKIEHRLLQMFLSALNKHKFPSFNVEISSYKKIEEFITQEDSYYAENILLFYDFNFERIRVLLEKYPDTKNNVYFHNALYDIINFMLDFDKLEYNEIKQKVKYSRKNIPYNGYTEIKTILNKVLQYKLNLVGLIKDAIIYSRFAYFVADSYLDSRGRSYNAESSLNIQNNPTAKMFVSAYHNDGKYLDDATIKIIRDSLKIHSLDPEDKTLFNFANIKLFKPDITKDNIKKTKDTLQADYQETIYNKAKEKKKSVLKKHKSKSKKTKSNPKHRPAEDPNPDPGVIEFFKENRKAYIQSLKNYFKSSLSTEDFMAFLYQCGYKEKLSHDKKKEKEDDNTENVKINYLSRVLQLEFLKQHVKKLRKVWVVFKLIIILCKKVPEIKYFYTEYDFNNSGSQHIATFLTHKRLAEEANLLGKEDFDAYTFVLSQYHALLCKLDSVRSFFEKSQEPITLSQEKGMKNKIITNTMIEASLEDNSHFNKLLQYNIMKSPGIMTALLQCYSVFKGDIPKDISALYTIIPSDEQYLIATLTEEYYRDNDRRFQAFCQYILVLRVAYNIQRYFKKYPWLNLEAAIWKERDLFKKPLMTSYYNSTRFTRIKHFQKVFLEHSQDYAEGITEQALYYLANNLELYFSEFYTRHLLGVIAMQNLTKVLIAKAKPIIISNKFFNITLRPSAFKSVQVETRTLTGKKQQLSIRIPSAEKPDNEKIYRQIKTSVSPNIIHSMDAWLVHSFNYKIRQINDKLYQAGKPFRISTYTNHDNFACNLSALVPILLKECFLELIASNYISNILDLTEKEIKEFRKPLDKVETPITVKEFYNLFMSNTNPKFLK